MSSLPHLQVRTTVGRWPTHLFQQVPSDDLVCWMHQGEGLIGWGEAARLEVEGQERFSRAQRWMTDLASHADIDDAVRTSGSGLCAFASLTFDDGPSTSVVIIPRVILGRRGGQQWLTTIEGGVDSPPKSSLPRAVGSVTRQHGTATDAAWKAAVNAAVERITAGDIDKVVLARDIVAQAPRPIDVAALLDTLHSSYPECWTFAVDGLIGATPELLIRRSGTLVTSRVLAGTMPREEDALADVDLGRALLNSDKNLEEHLYAVDSVASALARHCTDLDVPPGPALLRLKNVQHLVTDVTGEVADGTSAIGLAASLHPTAAVCGTPTERALATIRELEGMDRGRYAGPVGWMDAEGDGEFGIALRCGQLEDHHSMRLFAGCGIVAGSDPDTEWSESEAKLDAMRSALGVLHSRVVH